MNELIALFKLKEIKNIKVYNFISSALYFILLFNFIFNSLQFVEIARDLRLIFCLTSYNL